jgi:hypothetical protein
MKMKLLPNLTVILSILMMGCAGISPPAGGPPDTVPPTILGTYPTQNATRVETKKITLEFSEYVDRNSVQDAIFISPYIGSLEYSWSGTEVDIVFSDSLRAHTTYVVTVGTDVIDINNQNRMAQSYTLAFSTGDSIDHGIVAGKIFDAKPEGILIFAYRLEGLTSDTLNPAHTHPDFITQSGKGGYFSLQNIPDGPYRLIAVRDEFRNFLYDAGIDEYGIPFKDIRLDQQHRLIGDIFLRMTKEDTARIALLFVQAKDNRHIMLRFNKAIRRSGIVTGAFGIIDSLSGDSVIVRDWFAQPRQFSSLYLVTDTLRPGAKYNVGVSALAAEDGDSLSIPQRNIFFEAPTARDTIKPRIQLFTPADSARDIPFSQSVEVQFDDAVRRDTLEKGFTLLDSTGVSVQGTFRWLNSAMIRYQPLRVLRGAEWYTAVLRGRSVIDYAGNVMRDSLARRRFRTVDAAQLSSISGSVIDSTMEKGEIVVVATEVGGPVPLTYTVVADATGTFSIPDLPEGRYFLQTFRDRGGKQMYSYGKPFPYQEAARFGVYPDTVKLRARWPLEGMIVKMK